MEPVSPAAAEGTAATIVDVTTESFMADVIEASNDQLVLLDLWAPWCGPCKQLTPLLEQVTAQANGAVKLAKMNIDEHPAVAQQLQVQSIPAVFAFKDGRPVDGFMGALPESQIKEFVTRHLGDELGASPLEEMLAMAAQAMDQGDMASAAQVYGEVLKQDPAHIGAIAGLAQAHFAAGNLEQAEQFLAMAPEGANDPELASARATIALAAKTDELGDDAQALLDMLAADPNNHQVRFDLALVYHGAGQREEAMDALLEIVARKRDWEEERARKQLLEFFDAYGAGDDLVAAARRRLSSILFS